MINFFKRKTKEQLHEDVIKEAKALLMDEVVSEVIGLVNLGYINIKKEGVVEYPGLDDLANKFEMVREAKEKLDIAYELCLKEMSQEKTKC